MRVDIADPTPKKTQHAPLGAIPRVSGAGNADASLDPPISSDGAPKSTIRSLSQTTTGLSDAAVSTVVDPKTSVAKVDCG